MTPPYNPPSLETTALAARLFGENQKRAEVLPGNRKNSFVPEI